MKAFIKALLKGLWSNKSNKQTIHKPTVKEKDKVQSQ